MDKQNQPNQISSEAALRLLRSPKELDPKDYGLDFVAPPPIALVPFGPVICTSPAYFEQFDQFIYSTVSSQFIGSDESAVVYCRKNCNGSDCLDCCHLDHYIDDRFDCPCPFRMQTLNQQQHNF